MNLQRIKGLLLTVYEVNDKVICLETPMGVLDRTLAIKGDKIV